MTGISMLSVNRLCRGEMWLVTFASLVGTALSIASTKCESKQLGGDGEHFQLVFNERMGTAWVHWIIPDRVHARIRIKTKSVPACKAFQKALSSESFTVLTLPKFLKWDLLTVASSLGETANNASCPAFPLIIKQTPNELSFDCFFRRIGDADVKYTAHSPHACIALLDIDALDSMCVSLKAFGSTVLDAATRVETPVVTRREPTLEDTLRAAMEARRIAMLGSEDSSDEESDSDSDWDA